MKQMLDIKLPKQVSLRKKILKLLMLQRLNMIGRLKMQSVELNGQRKIDKQKPREEKLRLILQKLVKKTKKL
jgi:hypothetical protein